MLKFGMPTTRPKSVRARTRLRPPPVVQKRISFFSSALSIIWKALVFVSMILGIAAGGYYFLPTMTIDHSEAIDNKDPFSVKFTITNTSPFPLLIDAAFGLCKIQASITVNGTSNDDGSTNDCIEGHNPAKISPVWWKDHWLDRSGGKYEIALYEPLEAMLGDKNILLLHDKFRYAEVSLIVYYRPLGLSGPILKPNFEARFVGKARTSGVDWSRQTIDHSYSDPLQKKR
jgi:hypothetical protein